MAHSPSHPSENRLKKVTLIFFLTYMTFFNMIQNWFEHKHILNKMLQFYFPFLIWSSHVFSAKLPKKKLYCLTWKKMIEALQININLLQRDHYESLCPMQNSNSRVKERSLYRRTRSGWANWMMMNFINFKIIPTFRTPIAFDGLLDPLGVIIERWYFSIIPKYTSDHIDQFKPKR